MAPKGTFADRDPSEVIDLLDKKVLGKGVVGKLFGRIDGVVIRPSWPGGAPGKSMRNATETGIPQARISSAELTRSGPSVFLSPGEGMSQDEALAAVAAAGVKAPATRTSFGQHLYDFPPNATAAELVTFAVAALRAIGAEPVEDQWEFVATVPDD